MRRYALWGGGTRYVQVGSAQDRVTKARRRSLTVVVRFRLEGLDEFLRDLRRLERAVHRVERSRRSIRAVQV